MHPNNGLEALNCDQILAHFAAIVKSSEDAIVSKTLEGVILSWNAGAQRLYGYTASEAIGQRMTLVLPDDRAGEEAAILERIGKGESVEHFETVRRRKNGDLIDISLSISPIRDAEGRIIGASHVARNISVRLRVDEESRRLAAVVQSSDDAIISKTLDGKILSWNAGAGRIYGYSSAEVIGKSMTLVLPEDRPDEESLILGQIRRGEKVQHLETVRRRKNGERIDVSIAISPVYDAAGRIIGASHVARDITERRKLEFQLHQMASIVADADDAIVSKTLDGVILTWNASAERIYGYTQAEAVGHPMAMLLPEGRPNEENEILERIRRGERVEHFETVRKTKSGKLIDVSLTISPIHDKSGKIVGASHVARDVSERKQLEEQLRHTQKLESLGLLAGGVAHDFNNLLTGILGNASLALEGLSPDHPVRAQVSDVISASERAAHLTRQLLAYAGKGRFVVDLLDVSGLVHEISTLVQAAIPKNVHLQLELQDDLPPIEGDSSQIQQIIMNLVINGAEAIGPKENGVVFVTVALQHVDEHYCLNTFSGSSELPPGEYVSLDVHDTGCGMDAVTLTRIFDPFFTTKFTGRGLGLAAVQGIVRGHKGAMKVSSEPGKGSTFKVLFPASQRTATPKKITAPTPRRATEVILVVDDEEIIRRTAKSMLERSGYVVVLAEDGKEGVELFRVLADKLSLVLLDMTMPSISGEEALSRMKAIKPDVKVILSSGFNEVEALRRFTGKGLAGFLQKPYSSAALREKIATILERSPSDSPAEFPDY